MFQIFITSLETSTNLKDNRMSFIEAFTRAIKLDRVPTSDELIRTQKCDIFDVYHDLSCCKPFVWFLYINCLIAYWIYTHIIHVLVVKYKNLDGMLIHYACIVKPIWTSIFMLTLVVVSFPLNLLAYCITSELLKLIF